MTKSRLVTKGNLIDLLRIELPGFEINPEWVEDELGYPIINDLARYICDQARLGDFDEVRKGLAFLEMSLEGGDSYIRDLVLESLETLVSCKDIESMKEHFGSRVGDLWNALFQKDYEKRFEGGRPKTSS